MMTKKKDRLSAMMARKLSKDPRLRILGNKMGDRLANMRYKKGTAFRVKRTEVNQMLLARRSTSRNGSISLSSNSGIRRVSGIGSRISSMSEISRNSISSRNSL